LWLSVASVRFPHKLENAFLKKVFFESRTPQMKGVLASLSLSLSLLLLHLCRILLLLVDLS